MVKSTSTNWTITMVTIGIVFSFAIGIALIVVNNADSRGAKSFEIDYIANTFLMDGEPFRYISGSFHYFRALPETWSKKLKTMRAAGLNAVATYVEWALHNPKDNDVYDFNGIADIERFIRLAKEEGLYVILRPGPYICAERDNGGLPFWLFSKYPNIKLRTNDPDYKREVSKWYAELMPRIKPFLYGNGGPIIMVQVENEYGSFPACDKKYLNWLRDETEVYVQKKAILFTTDGSGEKMLACGKIDGVFATIDFGANSVYKIDTLWENLRKVQPNGPLVNSEYYPGWLTHWQENSKRHDPDFIAESLRKILKSGASVNLYMFFGGTNFGFTAGANDGGPGKYNADITSYDYDAPMDEAGDPTIKYIKIRNVINEFLVLPDIPVPDKQPKMLLDPITLKPIALLISDIGKEKLGIKSIESLKPKSFEELNQFSGLVLYETELPELKIDPSVLTINYLHDRALIYIDNYLIGVLSRENAIISLPISSGYGKNLKILVENQGRINFIEANDMKGILGCVTVQQLNGQVEILENWTSISMPLEYNEIKELIDLQNDEKIIINNRNGILLEGPVLFYADFFINNAAIHDTYLDTSDWGKGVTYINGFNLGRYWPLVGPQKTLYVPKELLKSGKNEIVLLEYQKSSTDGRIIFTSTPKLDG